MITKSYSKYSFRFFMCNTCLLH